MKYVKRDVGYSENRRNGLTGHLEVRISHVVYGEDKTTRVVVDGLSYLVDEVLLELKADLLARLGESDDEDEDCGDESS